MCLCTIIKSQAFVEKLLSFNTRNARGHLINATERELSAVVELILNANKVQLDKTGRRLVYKHKKIISKFQQKSKISYRWTKKFLTANIQATKDLAAVVFHQLIESELISIQVSENE